MSPSGGGRSRREREKYQKTYPTVLEAVPDAVLITDAVTGEIVEANGQVAAILGDDPETLLGEPQTVVNRDEDEARYRDLYARWVPEDGTILTQFPDGTGFGLTIVAEIARAHGWRVTVIDGHDVVPASSSRTSNSSEPRARCLSSLCTSPISPSAFVLVV